VPHSVLPTMHPELATTTSATIRHSATRLRWKRKMRVTLLLGFIFDIEHKPWVARREYTTNAVSGWGLVSAH
jgi:hypothetical protein